MIEMIEMIEMIASTMMTAPVQDQGTNDTAHLQDNEHPLMVKLKTDHAPQET
jgi:hypothetical protein